MGADVLDRGSQKILNILSHPLRRDIVKSLEEGPGSYSMIMLECGLDPNHDSGLFSYHLNGLIGSNIIKRLKDGYELTDLGRRALAIARSAEGLGEGRKQGGTSTPSSESERRRSIDLAKVVRVEPMEEASIRIDLEDCMIQRGSVYWGLTRKTIGVDEVTYLWRLHDGSVIFEVRDPGYGGKGWTMHHLREDGLFTLGGAVEITKGGQKAIESFNEAWMGKILRVYPLPLEIGKKWSHESRSLQTSTNPAVTGWESRDGTSTYTGEVMGEYGVTIDSNSFDCLLLREVVVSSGTTTRQDGEVDVGDPTLRVLMDRYLNPQGRLRLEHLWYTQEGGKRSMTRDEAQRKAGSNFDEMDYAGRTWYRVIQVPLDEPRPPEAKRWIKGDGN